MDVHELCDLSTPCLPRSPAGTEVVLERLPAKPLVLFMETIIV